MRKLIKALHLPGTSFRPVWLIVSLTAVLLLWESCGNNRTRHLIQDKRWNVQDVTPPANGNFDIEDENEAQQLKAGFYKNAWFEFTSQGIFKASFDGKLDSGKYNVGSGGHIISLYTLHADTMYEQIQIQLLNNQELDFNTLISSFYMTLHCKAQAP